MKKIYYLAILYGILWAMCRYGGLTPAKVSRYLDDFLNRYGL